METRITATAARKAAKKLGDDHPAVREWRAVASGRVARINKADATPTGIGNPNLASERLEAAKRKLIEAAGL